MLLWLAALLLPALALYGLGAALGWWPWGVRPARVTPEEPWLFLALYALCIGLAILAERAAR